MTETNEAERQHWNDPRWSTLWPKREQLTAEVTSYLLRHAALQPGERVLDVGSGGGGTSFAAGEAVGVAGAVVGADLSLPLVELARRRGLDRGALNVTFESLDMQIQPVPGRPFDVAISQFGVMFFEDPVEAFKNIRDQLQKLGRVAFACWQEPETNPWLVRPIIARFLPPAELAEGAVAPGPFAFADPVRVTGILEAAGFAEVRRTPYEITVDAPLDAVVDDDHIEASGIAPERQAEAQAALDEHMAQFALGDGGLSRFPLAFQVFEARVR